jgi:hypothetical protein
VIRGLRAFGAFWYDFIVGDDWQVAVGVVAALTLTFGLGRAGAPAWWVLPLTVAVLLPYSLHRATRHERRPEHQDTTAHEGG